MGNRRELGRHVDPSIYRRYYKELCSAVLKKVDPLSQRVLLDTIRHELPPEHTEWLATRCGLWDGLGKILLIDPKLSAFVVAPRGKKVTRPGSDGRHHPLAHQFRRASWGLSDMEYLVMNCNEIADQLRDVDERRSVGRRFPADLFENKTKFHSAGPCHMEALLYCTDFGKKKQVP